MSAEIVEDDDSDNLETELNATIADQLFKLVHTVTRMRASIATAQGDESEWMQNRLLFHLATTGPMRAGALAESIEADPSTVSRQVAALVKAELIERRADPVDGRASLLVLTTTGRALFQRHLDRRDVHYSRMLENWNLADRAALADLLGRFTNDFDTYKTVMLAEICAPRSAGQREEHQ